MRNFIVGKDEKVSGELKKVVLSLLNEDNRAKMWLNDPRCGIRLTPALNGDVILTFTDGGVHPCHYGPSFCINGAGYKTKAKDFGLTYTYFPCGEIKLSQLYTVVILTYDFTTLNDDGFYTQSLEEAQNEARRLESEDSDCYQAYVELW